MNSNLYQKLRAKGWSKADINKAANIINKAEKPKKIQLLDEVIYWFILVIAIIGNIVISIALVPFLIALKSSFLYLVIILMAITFGFLFDSLIRDIESLEQKHVIIAGLFIPVLALINVFYITHFANYVSQTLNLDNTHNPFLVSIVYVAGFIAPYLIYRIVNKEPFY